MYVEENISKTRKKIKHKREMYVEENTSKKITYYYFIVTKVSFYGIIKYKISYKL